MDLTSKHTKEIEDLIAKCFGADVNLILKNAKNIDKTENASTVVKESRGFVRVYECQKCFQ